MDGYLYDGKLCSHIEGFASANYNRDNILPIMRQMGGRFSTILNDYELAKMWVNAGGRPVLRMLTEAFNDDDPENHFESEPYADLINRLLNYAEADQPPPAPGKRKIGVAHLGNEVFDEDPARQDQWMSRGIKRFTADNRQCIIQNFAVWHPKDPLAYFARMPLTIAALRENRGWLGFHNGTYGDLWKAEDAIAAGIIGNMREVCRIYGLRAGITEFAGSKDPNNGYKVLYADKGGTPTWVNQIDRSMLLSLDEYVDFVCFFTLKKWSRGTGFEYEDDPAFLKGVANLNRKYVVKDVPVTQPIPAPTTGGTPVKITALPPDVPFRNVRVQPTANATDVGDLKVGDAVIVFLNAKQGEWAYITRADATDGWTLWTGVQYEVIPAPTENITYTKAEHDKLLAAVNAVQVELDGLRLHVKGAPTPSGEPFF